ncbi:hypothetical protein V8D89_003563 [Ganoderma adspersum]
MQRFRKISNGFKEALLPKSREPELRPSPSHREAQPTQTTDSRKTANRSLGYNDSAAVTTGSLRETRTERERRERDKHRQAMKPAREQGPDANSVAFPSSSSRSKAPTKAQEKPVPVPSLNHKQAAGQDPRTKPLPPPPGTLPARKPHRRPPYSPSRHFAMSQSTPDVTLPFQTRSPTTNGCTPASPDSADLSTPHSIQSQSGVPLWPPEGPANVRRQKRTPKSSIDSLHRSQTMKDLCAPATTPKDAGHGHSRTASAPTTGDAQTLPRRREQQVTQAAPKPYPKPEPKEPFSDDVSETSIYSQSSYRTTGSSAREPKTSLQVRELPTSRSVHVQQPGTVRRAASHKAQIVYPSYVTSPLPPLPVPAPVPGPAPQREAEATPSTPRFVSPKGREGVSTNHPGSGSSMKGQRMEVEYFTMRQKAQMEDEETSMDLRRELAEWDRDGVNAEVVPAPASSSGATRPLVVKKRSEIFGVRTSRR